MGFLCAFCQDPLTSPKYFLPGAKGHPKELSIATNINCGHLFHLTCLGIEKSNIDRTCPTCQTPIEELTRLFPLEELEEPNNSVNLIKSKDKTIGELLKNLEACEKQRVKAEQKLEMEIYKLANENEKLRDQVDGLQGRNDPQGQGKRMPTQNPTNLPFDLSRRDSGISSPSTPSTARAMNDSTYQVQVLERTDGGLMRNDKVVWILDAEAYHGQVVWLGRINKIITAGVKFAEPIGDFNGSLGSSLLFHGNESYDRLVPVTEVMLASDYFA